jgi:hypothetical protein
MGRMKDISWVAVQNGISLTTLASPIHRGCISLLSPSEKNKEISQKAVFRIRKFLGTPEPDLDVLGTDPDPFIIVKKP